MLRRIGKKITPDKIGMAVLIATAIFGITLAIYL